MKTILTILTVFLSVAQATASGEDGPTGIEATDENHPEVQASRPFSDRSPLLQPGAAVRRSLTTVRFGLQLMPMLQINNSGTNSDPDKSGMLTMKKLSPTIGAGAVLKIELSPYLQLESGVNFTRKNYTFEQESFNPDPKTKQEVASGSYSLSLPAYQFEFPVLLSFGFGSARTQKTYFRPVLGLILCRYNYGTRTERRNVTTTDPDYVFEVSKLTLRELETANTSSSAALGLVGFRVLTTTKKKAFEYGLSYCHDLGEGDRMVVITRILKKSANSDQGNSNELSLITQSNFLRFHLTYYLYNSR